MATFEERIKKITGTETPPTASLKFLSDMSSDYRSAFRAAWPDIPLATRRRIVSDLVTVAEDNIELNFRHVFLTALEDSDPQVRRTAVEGLYEDESKLLLGRLLPMLRNDPDLGVREAVAKAMGRFTYLAHCEKLGSQGTQVREMLLEAASDQVEDSDVKRRAVEALGFFHGDDQVNRLIEDAYDQGGTYAESALFAMGRSMDERWHPTVLDELQSTTPAMRYEAARAAGEMILEAALHDLVQLTDDDDLEVKLAAVWALGQIGGKIASQALARVLKSNNPAMREAAREALDELLFNADPLNVAAQATKAMGKASSGQN